MLEGNFQIKDGKICLPWWYSPEQLRVIANALEKFNSEAGNTPVEDKDKKG